jgi:hypothetical protein
VRGGGIVDHGFVISNSVRNLLFLFLSPLQHKGRKIGALHPSRLAAMLAATALGAAADR